MKPPVPNFAANKAKREAEQIKKDRLAPTSFLGMLIKGHYRSFSQRLMERETPKRVKALTNMRKEMQKRYMLLYRHFRLKKYGEPIPKKLLKGGGNDEVEEFKEDTDLLDRIQAMLKNNFEMEEIAEAKKPSDEVDEISDFGSEAPNVD